MLNTLLIFLCTTLGFISMVIIYNNRKDKTSPFINKYLIFLILNTSFRYIFHFIFSINPSFFPYTILILADSSLLIASPFFYLYFEDLIFEEKFNKKKLLHFALPSILIILLAISNIVENQKHLLIVRTFIIVGGLSILFYLALGFKLLYTNVWFRKSEIKLIQDQNKLIRNWTLFLYFTFVSIFIFRFFMITIFYGNVGYNHNEIWLPALTWSLIFLKFIITPEIQYGYGFLNKKNEASTNQYIIPKLWSLETPTEKINLPRDIKLAEKLNASIKRYIHQIEDAAFHSQIFRNQDISTDDIATHLKIPSSHIRFVFKYHCKETFSDYKKIVRVHDASKLLDNGYLKNNTIDSLSAEVGFVTYNTFHVAFKSITGITTLEYIKKISQPTG
jgi:AraC-like DNA-binding protein